MGCNKPSVSLIVGGVPGEAVVQKLRGLSVRLIACLSMRRRLSFPSGQQEGAGDSEFETLAADVIQLHLVLHTICSSQV